MRSSACSILILGALGQLAGCKDSGAQGSTDGGAPAPAATAADPAHKTQADDEPDRGGRGDRRHARAEERAEARQARAGAQAVQQAQGQAALAAICNAIQLDPSHAAAFSIDKAVATNALTCEVTVQAKTLINSLHFTWTFFDKDGVKLGQAYPRIENLAVGDKQKLTFTMDEGTAKVVSKPR